MSGELKRCPFCGGEAMILYDGLDKECCVSCRNNDCEFCGDAGDDEQAVIDKWNTRPLEDALQAEVDRLMEAAEYTLNQVDYMRLLWGDEGVVNGIATRLREALEGGE